MLRVCQLALAAQHKLVGQHLWKAATIPQRSTTVPPMWELLCTRWHTYVRNTDLLPLPEPLLCSSVILLFLFGRQPALASMLCVGVSNVVRTCSVSRACFRSSLSSVAHSWIQVRCSIHELLETVQHVEPETPCRRDLLAELEAEMIQVHRRGTKYGSTRSSDQVGIDRQSNVQALSSTGSRGGPPMAQ